MKNKTNKQTKQNERTLKRTLFIMKKQTNKQTKQKKG